MKKHFYSFPSVYEANGTNLSFVSRDLINGLQLYDEKEQSYIIGDLALREGISPNKLVNSSPYEVDYQLFLKAGILLANYENNRPLAITTGFPFSTYQVYKDIARDLIMKLDTIEYNPGTFSHQERTKVRANIQQVEILPEMIGNIIALRVGEEQASGNFFVVSLGYGTCEAVLSTETGIIHRTALSINGMQYAVDLFMRSLATKYYLGLKTEKQLDVSFRQDHIILDREKINIVDLRRRILERYYKDIVSSGLRRSFSDSDFEKADRIYLTGGGALFPELVEQFENEFQQIAKVMVVKNPLTLTSEGYCLNSIMLTNGEESTAIGLDVGNANTVLTQYEKENLVKEPVQEKIVVEKIEKKPEIKAEPEKEPEKIIEKEEPVLKIEKKEVETKPVIEEKPQKLEKDLAEKEEEMTVKAVKKDPDDYEPDFS
jgi:plasmid segregation protein ParM